MEVNVIMIASFMLEKCLKILNQQLLATNDIDRQSNIEQQSAVCSLRLLRNR